MLSSYVLYSIGVSCADKFARTRVWPSDFDAAPVVFVRSKVEICNLNSPLLLCICEHLLDCLVKFAISSNDVPLGAVEPMPRVSLLAAIT
eukprot:SAG11_NODE_21190_length_430_cov_0.694864_2_plen_90_part_00